jgi:acyl-CoA thioesterase-1
MPRALSTLLVFVFVVLALPAAAAERSILVVGDSLSAAYGIARNKGWVALLESRLKSERIDYSVVNASISGDTTSGGLARLKPLLDKHRPEVVVLELGANDGLRGLPVAQIRSNLASLVGQAQAANARVLLLGVRLPPNYGEDYTRSFDGMFAEVAKSRKTALVPFMMEGFADKPEFFLPDRIHPAEEAQPLILERVWKGLRPLLK